MGQMYADDMDLVRDFAADGFEAAFATLVGRHVNLLYSAALRRLGNAHDAGEVAQAVFIILARKAVALAGEPFFPAGCIKPRNLRRPISTALPCGVSAANRRLLCNSLNNRNRMFRGSGWGRCWRKP